jgi:hypothetical protein
MGEFFRGQKREIIRRLVNVDEACGAVRVGADPARRRTFRFVHLLRFMKPYKQNPRKSSILKT